jgi:hypothetical protein
MDWRRLYLCFVMGSPFLGTGCASDDDLICPVDTQAGMVTRMQKSDTLASAASPPNYLDMLPDQPGDATSGEVAARICATVNGVPIFEEEVRATALEFVRFARQLPEPERSNKIREIYKDVLDQLIERELEIQEIKVRLKKAGPTVMQKLEEAADKEFDSRWVESRKKLLNLKTDEELKNFLRQQGMSFDMVRRQFTRQFMAQEYLRNIIIPVLGRIQHPEMVDYYEQHPEEFKQDDAVEWQDIFLSTVAGGKYHSREEAQKAAEQLLERIKKGEDFLALCKQFDDGNAKLSPTAAGTGHKRGEISPPGCEAPLFQMKPGDVNIFEINTGFHVYKLVKREFAGLKPFNLDVQKEITQKLKQAMYEREVKKKVEELKKKAVIVLAHAPR